MFRYIGLYFEMQEKLRLSPGGCMIAYSFGLARRYFIDSGYEIKHLSDDERFMIYRR